MSWPDIAAFWSNIQAFKTPGWSKGKAFEHFVLRCFELSGTKVIWPYPVTLGADVVEQIDGMVISSHITCMVEVKHSKDAINVEPIAKLRNQLLRRPAGVIGSVFSYSGFTAPAKTLAQYTSPQAILLWEGQEVDSLVTSRKFPEALARKYEYLVQMGLPDFDTRVETL